MTYCAIPLSWARRQASGAVAGGLDLNGLFERALIAPRFDDDRDCLSPTQLTLLYASLVEGTGDEAHAMSRRPIPLGYGSLAFRVMWGSDTLETAIQAASRLYELSESSMRIKLSVTGEQAFLAVGYDDAAGPTAYLLEDCYLGFLFMGLSQFVGRPFPLSWVATRDPLHMNLGGDHWSTRAPTRLGRTAGFAFPRALLATPPAPQKPGDARWRAFQDWIDFVEQEPLDEPPPGVSVQMLRVDALARAHNTSPMTYRRRIASREGGFRSVRQRALADAGVRLLRGSNDSVDAVAIQLGYSDARSFRRFMKGATGRTPDQLRAGFSPARRDPLVLDRLKSLIERMPG